MSLNDDSRPTTPHQSHPPAASSAQKADQIASRFFIKFLLILVSSRSTAIEHGPRSTKVDKWFNLETPDTDIHRDHMRLFRAISSMSTPPTLVIHIVLTIPELGSNKALVALGPSDQRVKIEPTPRGILLETWTLSATQLAGVSAGSSLSSSDPGELSLAAVYKHAISLFRSLYTLCRQLPAARLYQQYRQRAGVTHPSPSSSFGIDLRLQLDQGVLAFDPSPSSPWPAWLQTSSHAFPGLSTPLGILKISVRYLTQPKFRIDTLESLISSRLFHQDAGQIEESVAFTPTVQAHRARDSAASSPSTTGIAMRGSRQPVTVGPRHSRTISFPASGAAVSLAKATQDQASSRSGSASDRSIHAPLVPNTSAGSSPRYGGFTPAFVTPGSLGRGTPLKPGRESLEMPKVGGAERSSPGTSTSPPSNLSRLRPEGVRLNSLPPTNVPIIPAFKSSTFSPAALNSPSSSLRTHGPGTPIMSRPPSSLPYAIPETSGAGASSRPWPTVASSPPSAGLAGPLSEPPPFAASSSVPRGVGSPLANLNSGSPHSGDSAVGSPAKLPGTKRYSSSFSHRRAPSAGVSGTSTPAESATRRASVRPEGSPAAHSGDLPPERSRPSSTILDPTKHEDELSEYLRAFETVQPLRRAGLNDSHSSGSASPSAGHTRRISLAERRQSPLIGRIELPPPSPRSPPARLQELNLADLEGRHNSVSGTGNRMPLSPPQQDIGAQLQTMDTNFSQSLRALQERRRSTMKGTVGQESGQTFTSGRDVDATMRGGSIPLSSENSSRDRISVAQQDVTPEQIPLFTPGAESTASDGSGYAGIVGPLDLESPELRTAAVARPPLSQAVRTDVPNTSAERRSIDSDRSDKQSGLGITTSPGGVETTKRTSKYTSVLRRDATIRPGSTSSTVTGTSGAGAGSTSLSTQATRRPATGWSGNEPSAP